MGREVLVFRVVFSFVVVTCGLIFEAEDLIFGFAAKNKLKNYVHERKYTINCWRGSRLLTSGGFLCIDR